jgi:hypothetical protein
MMKVRTRVAAVTGFLLAFGSVPEMVPAQMFAVRDPIDFTVNSGRLQKWENELGGTDCEGACPDGSSNCCRIGLTQM